MKKNIYILGMICLSIVFLATVFKISHLAGAGILLIAGIGSLTLIFLPIAFYSSLKSTDDKLLKFLYVAAFISFFVDFVGMVFKVLHWPGAGLIMIIGIPLPFVLFLPAYINYHVKRKLKTDLNFFVIVLFMIYLGVFSSFLAIDPNLDSYMVYAHSTSEVSKSNNFLTAALTDKKETEISISAGQLVKQIEEIKLRLAKASSPDKKAIILPDGSINYFEIENKGTVISPEQFNKEGLDKFNREFEKYSKTVSELYPKSDIIRLIDEINEYRLPKYKGDVPVIAQLPLISALNVLTDWQNKLLLISYMQASKSI